MDKVDLIQELSDLINKNVDAADFPYKKGNSIRIGAYAIRKKKNNYIVIDCMTNKIIEQCFSKAAAIALAKRLAKGKGNEHPTTQEIMNLDNKLSKNYIDCIFYSYTIKNTKDEFKKSATRDRYEIARYEVEASTEALESNIFR